MVEGKVPKLWVEGKILELWMTTDRDSTIAKGMRKGDLNLWGSGVQLVHLIKSLRITNVSHINPFTSLTNGHRVRLDKFFKKDFF